MQAKSKIISVKEDDDYFEEFDEEDWSVDRFKGLVNSNADWDDTWEDKPINENLEKQIKSEIEKFNSTQEINK